MNFHLITLFHCTFLAAPALAQTLFFHDEATSGDLSDNYLSPTQLTVGLGNNILTGSLSGGTNDLDLFELIVPQGLEVTAIRLLDFEGGLAGSFLIMQPGSTLSAPPANDFSDPVGFTILSPGGVGSDLLPTIALPGITSLAPFFGVDTLTEGSYAGWLNETGPSSTYSLQFEASSTTAVPEPSAALLASLAALGLCTRRQR